MNTDLSEIASISTIATKGSEAAKNIWDIVEKIFPYFSIRRKLVDAHIKNIQDISESEKYDEITKAFIYCRYQQDIKEAKTCTSIIEFTEKILGRDARPENVSSDWYAYFFDKARLISRVEFQEIWGHILARKIEGWDVSKKLIHTLSVMEERDIDAFCTIAKMTFQNVDRQEAVYPLIFIKDKPSIYNNAGIYRYTLSELQVLGLLDFDLAEGFVFPANCKEIQYGEKTIRLPQEKGKRLEMGNVKITHDGQVLWSAIKREYDDEFFDFCERYINDR